jgi:hypothetical protein
MAQSIELLLDPDTDAAIRRCWQRLAEAGLPSQAAVKSPTNRPHVTLAVAERIAPSVDASLTLLSRRLPLRCRVGAALLFGGRKVTLARLVVPSAELMSVHAQVLRLSSPHLAPGPHEHTQPGQWTPHVTLARRVDPGDVARALHVLGAAAVDIDAAVVGLRRWDGDARVEHLLAGTDG